MMIQKQINRNVDYLYKLQIGETEHQHHRLSWILAAQSIMFASLSVLISCEKSGGLVTDALIALFIAVGVSLSISGIYSILVGELSIGTVLERWDEYDCRQKSEKYDEIPHVVILSPSTVMQSRLKFLLIYSFAPKVLCAGWMALFFFYIAREYFGLAEEYYRLMLISTFCGILLLVCIVTGWFGKYLLYEWFYKDTKEKRQKKNSDANPCVAIVDNDPQCGRVVNIRCNGNLHCQLNNINSGNGKCVISYNNRNCGCPCGCHYKSGRCINPCSNVNPIALNSSHLNIYHIVVDRFNGGWTTPPANANTFLGGNIKGIIDKLDYIADLGYNAILLTPIFESHEYHGYHTVDYTQIDSHFGTWQDFQELIDKAHAKNMKVMCDFVPNHCHITNKWFVEAQRGNNNPYRNRFYFDKSRLGGYVSYQNFPDLPKFNLYDSATSDCMTHIAMNLVKKGIDGLRIDHAIGVPFRFLKELNAALKRINPNIFVFGEVWPVNLTDVSQVEFKNCMRKDEVIKGSANMQDNIQLDYIGVLDGVLDFEYRNIILDEIRLGHRLFGNSTLQRKLEAHFSKYPSHFQLLLFLDNHDTNRIMLSCNQDQSLVDEAVLFTQTQPYPSIIYYGTEKHMTNTTDINSGIPHADMEVRNPMDWN